MSKQQYGSWRSKISPEYLTAKNKKIAYPQSLDDKLFWQENDKDGLTIVKSHQNGQIHTESPADTSIGTGANVYGGQAWTPVLGGIVYVNKADQNIYLFRDGDIKPLTDDNAYYADFHYCEALDQIVFVAEIPQVKGFPKSEIHAIDLSSMSKSVRVSGADFYAFARLSPSGDRLTWMQWSLEAMSWEHSEVWLQDNDHAPQKVSGDQEAVFQPSFDRSGRLHWVTDKGGWWHICNEAGNQYHIAESEQGRPLWLYGWSTYCFDKHNRLLSLATQNGEWKLYQWLSEDEHQLVSVPFTHLEDIISTHTGVACIASHYATSSTLIDIADGAVSMIRESVSLDIDETHFSKPIAFEYPVNQETAHGFYYAPHNPEITVVPNDRPPVIVMIHGGPTAATDTSLNFKIQFWTSRGYAVLDLNYRGSTGYGRDYRLRLNEHWGFTDVEDVFAALDYAEAQGWCDPKKQLIKGSSAGGYTALSALIASQRFAAAAIHYGVADLNALDAHTHKFEATYNTSLIGKRPQHNDRYSERSPCNKASRIQTPTIFFQGDSDPVVAPEQTLGMVKTLGKNGVKLSYKLFAGEGHGFKQAQTVDYVLKAEHAFYAHCLGFEVAENDTLSEPLLIENDSE